jgi:hypothetical protein
MLASLIALIGASVMAVLVVGIVFAVLGVGLALVGIGVGLLFKLAPVILVGWVVLKLVERNRSSPTVGRLTDADRRWLES